MAEEEKPLDTTAPEVTNPFGEAFKNFFAEAEEAPAQPKAEAKEEGEKIAEPQAKEQAAPAKEEAPQQQAEDDDINKLLSIKPEDLKTKGGLPVTESSRQSFRNLQKALEKKHKELEEVRSKLNQAPKKEDIKLDEFEEYKKLVEEKERYKKELDLFAFENSDEWKNTFETPIKQRTERINSIITALELDDQDAKNASILIRKAQEYLGDTKKEINFSQVVDRIAEEFIKSPTAGRKFTDAMLELFDLTAKRAEAKADRDKARTEIRSKYEKQTASSIKLLQDRLDTELIAFENSDLGKIFKSAKAKDYDYDATSKANREKVLQAIKDFQVTGQVTSELAEMARHYALKPSFDKERDFFLKTNIQLSQATEKLLAENEELKRRISELRGEGKSDNAEVKPKQKGKDSYNLGSIFQGIEKVLAG